jgi:hypothetical protein
MDGHHCLPASSCDAALASEIAEPFHLLWGEPNGIADVGADIEAGQEFARAIVHPATATGGDAFDGGDQRTGIDELMRRYVIPAI